MAGQTEHVESVGGDVVCGGAESDKPEYGQCELEETVGRDGEGDSRQSGP